MDPSEPQKAEMMAIADAYSIRKSPGIARGPSHCSEGESTEGSCVYAASPGLLVLHDNRIVGEGNFFHY